MWPFKPSKPHLKYASIWEWKEQEGVPDGFISYEDPVLRNRWITAYSELRQHLFEKHIQTLDAEQQQLFRDQQHPSQSWRFEERARPYLDTLKVHLDQAGIIYRSVELGFYHMDRIVLSVSMDPAPKFDPKELPWLHRGFEIMFSFPHDLP